MRRALFGVLVLVFATVVVEAQERFTERISAEDRKAAGLDKLTPEQLAALDALVKRDRETGEKHLREQVRTELREEVKQEAKAETRKEDEERRLAETRVLSRIVGRFSGWEGDTVFTLENGQIWRQASPDVYYTKPVESPAVLIEKVFGGWRLYDQAGGWVRVVRVK